MSFALRLRALQALTVLGIVAIGIGLLTAPFSSRFTSLTAIHWLMVFGFVAAICCSIALSRLRCPRCGETFCGPRYDENARSSVFASSCMSCSHRPDGR